LSEKFAKQILSWIFYFNFEKNLGNLLPAGDFFCYFWACPRVFLSGVVQKK